MDIILSPIGIFLVGFFFPVGLFFPVGSRRLSIGIDYRSDLWRMRWCS